MVRLLSVYAFPIVALLFLSGCASPETPAVVSEEDVMLFLEPGLRPETVQFPEYLFMEEMELGMHGWIPQSGWVGGGLKTQTGLDTVFQRYNAVLEKQKWQVETAEVSDRSFRLLAYRNAETLEIRAVQGTGPTQIFILYKP